MAISKEEKLFLPYVQHLSQFDKVRLNIIFLELERIRRLHQIVIIIGIIIGLGTVCMDWAN